MVLGACRPGPEGAASQSSGPLPTETDAAAQEAARAFFRYRPGRDIIVGAHRGGAYPGYPENCLETMQYVSATAPGTVHEVDIARSADGALVLMHDDNLDRTTNGRGPVGSRRLEEIRRLRLKDPTGALTDFQVPLLSEALDWALQSNSFLMLDIKRGVAYEAVLEAVRQVGAMDRVVFITYSAGAARRLAGLDKDAFLSVNIRNLEEWARFRETNIPPERVIAFTGTIQSDPALYDTLHAHGILGILGTLGNLDRQAATRGDRLYRDFAARGVDMFSSDRPLEVYREFFGAR
jgi:glycerophosphoryl diester phosphodiesterase